MGSPGIRRHGLRAGAALVALMAVESSPAAAAGQQDAGPVPQSTGGLGEKDLAFLRALTETRNFSNGQPTAIQLTPDGATVLFLRGLARKAELRLYAFEVQSGAVRELASPESVLAGKGEVVSPEELARRERMRVTARGITGYQISRDGTQALFSLGGKVYLVPIAGGPPREVAGPGAQGEPPFDPKLAPDGKQVAFVRGNELWVAPLAAGANGKGAVPLQLTQGATAQKTHGKAEFVAQEELGRFTGYWWSPDSQKLCYEEVDNSGVERLWLSDPVNLFKPVEPSSYPRPGKANAKVAFGVVGSSGGPTTWIELDRARWEYVSRVVWEEGAPLTLIALDREQKELALLAADAQGKTRELIHEHDDAWVNSERAYRWLSGGKGFLWDTEQNGAWQLMLHDADGKLVRALTTPEQGYGKLTALAEEAGVAIFTGHQTPVQQQLFEVPLAGGPARPLGTGSADHVAAVFARKSRAHVRTVQPLRAAPWDEVFRADGTSAGLLPSVAEALPFEPRVELQLVGDSGPPSVGSGKSGFWTALVRPHDFDPKKKYPVLLQVYGGPHSNMVRPSAQTYLSDQWIANHGFLVVRADGRGTPLRGRAWERAIQDRFAEVPLDGQVAALQALAAKEPAIDLGRVGVVGGSFGGFLAALAVMRRPDVFRAAVASAPVVDWLNYDTCYTERYLGVPPPAGKGDSYGKNSLLAYADKLSRPLLLIHGTADDNVHFSETLLLGDALFRAGKHFELLPEVGQTHQSSDPALLLRYWERVFAFLDAHVR